jgi:general secretion pathway protein L
MSETLLIHYNIDHPHQATWSQCNEAGELTGRITTGSLDELSAIADRQHAVVLLNSQCLHINQLQLPTQNLQKMIKAVPYAIEEFIAEDIDDFHFVIAKNKHNNSTAVVGIDKSTLNNIVQVFQDANITIDKIIPDALCLAAAADSRQWVCLNYGDDSYLQTDTLNGMVFSHEVFPYVMTSKLQEESENEALPEKILLFCEQENPDAFAQVVIENDNIETINIVYNTHPLVVFCAHYKQAMPLNLLQHKFKPKRKTSGYWHQWRLAASLAMLWLVLNLSLSGFQLAKLQDENNITSAQIENIYKKTFPDSRKIVNPRVQMEQKLNELKNSSGNNSNSILYLLAESFGTLSQDKSNITLQTLTFRNNRMEIGLDSTNLQAIESLNKNLNSNTKIKSEITSSSSEKDKVKGNLRIEGRS